MKISFRPVAQLVEHRSPKPGVGGSSPSWPAMKKELVESWNMNKESTSKSLDNLKWLLAILVFAAAVVGNSYFVEIAFLYRVLGVLLLFIIGLGLIAITNFGSNSLKLMKESRTEIRKVVWPTRMETTQTFMIVFGSIILLCLFFWGLESLLSFLTSLVLG